MADRVDALCGRPVGTARQAAAVAYHLAGLARRTDGAEAAAVALLRPVGLPATNARLAATGGRPATAAATLDRVDARDLAAVVVAASSLGTGLLGRAWSAGAARPLLQERYDTAAEVAGLAGAAFGVPDGLLAASWERWDGHGFPGRLAGAQIPVPVRIAQVAEALALDRQLGPDLDPELVAAVGHLPLADVPPFVPDLLDALAAAGAVADLAWPQRCGHSGGVAAVVGPEGWLHELGGPVSAATAQACAAWTPPPDDLVRLAIQGADADQLARFARTSPRKAQARLDTELAALGVRTLGGAAFILGTQGGPP